MNPPSLAAGAVSVVVWWSIVSRELPEAAPGYRESRMPHALKSICDLVDEIASLDSNAARALESVKRDPGDAHARATLERHLSVLLVEESAFEVELTRLLAELGEVRHTDGTTYIDIYSPADDRTGGQSLLLVTIMLPWASAHLGRLTVPPTPYVGRGDAVHAALKVLESRREQERRGCDPPVVIVTGSAGSGKTGFARMVAHHMYRGRTSDLQVEVRLSEADPAVPGKTIARSSEDCLTEILTVLGSRVDDLPPGLESRKARYRQSLTGNRALIVLDEVRPASQVTQLLPPHDGAVIVTAEQPPGDLGPKSTVIALRALTPIECVQLLALHIGPDQVTSEAAAAQQLAQLSAGIPLAIVVMPGWFRSATTDRKLSTFAECVRDAFEDLSAIAPAIRPVIAALTVTYPALSGDQRYLMQVAALLRLSEYDVRFLSEASGRSLEQTRTVVGELVTSGLLDVFGLNGNRWRMHPLVADFAYAKALDSLTDGDRNEIIDRAISLLLRRSRSLEDLLSSPVINLDPALAAWAQAQLHQQRTAFIRVLRAALVFAVTRTMHLLAISLVNLLDLAGGWPDLSETLEPVLEIARHSQDPALEARARAHLEAESRPRPVRPEVTDDRSPEHDPAGSAERTPAADARPVVKAWRAKADPVPGTEPDAGQGIGDGSPDASGDTGVDDRHGGGDGGEGPGPDDRHGGGGDGGEGPGPDDRHGGGGDGGEGPDTGGSGTRSGPALDDVEAAAEEAAGIGASPRVETRFGPPSRLS